MRKIKSAKLRNTQMHNSFHTNSGMLRIRWWVPATILGFACLYAFYNIMVVMAVMGGAQGVADPFWNAPIYWMFGK